MKSLAPLPPHGRIACATCFGGCADWGRSITASEDGWTLENNPCAWGSRNPRFMVLGFSKGERQSKDILAKRHDDIPFAGFRDRVAGGLRRLGLLDERRDLDDLIRADEPDWAFGSLVRCSAAENGRKSGRIIGASSRAASYLAWRDACTERFLSHLPDRLQVVVMLSNGDEYIESCRKRITSLHPDTRPINDVAYGDGRVTWVHVVHFGGPGRNHMNNWMAFADNTAGRKGRLALEAVTRALEGA